jgi:hypothetical protein
MLGVNQMANEYVAGDKATVTGTVTSVGNNAGRTEYTVAVEEKDTEYNRPLNIAPAVDPIAFTDGYVEFQQELLKRDNERKDENAKDNQALSDTADETRKDTDTPDPRKTPVTNSNAPVAKPAASKSTSSNK